MGILSNQISLRELVPICRQMATAYDAGIPISKSLVMAERNATSGSTRVVFREMQEAIKAGETLGDAAREQKGKLPEFFVELLATGERGGKLDVMLRDLAEYYEDRMALQRTIIGSMAYPILMVAAAWFIGSFALGLVNGLDLEDPTPFSLEAYVAEYMAFQVKVLMGIAVAAVAIVVLSRTGIPQYVWGRFTTQVWPLSNVVKKFALARFFRTFALLLSSGINVKHCIVNAAETTANPVIKQDLLQALPIVSHGGTLTQAFAGCRTLTPMAHQMLAVGEESGQLDFQLRKVADYHFEEAKLAVHVALRFMNIGLMIGVGGLVGYVVISFYAKYFSLLDSI